jgi:hypothetical protein
LVRQGQVKTNMGIKKWRMSFDTKEVGDGREN